MAKLAISVIFLLISVLTQVADAKGVKNLKEKKAGKCPKGSPLLEDGRFCTESQKMDACTCKGEYSACDKYKHNGEFVLICQDLVRGFGGNIPPVVG